MACGDIKDLPRRATSDKVLHDKIFDIAKNQKHDGYQHGLATKVHQFFDTKSYVANTFGGVLKMQQCYLPPLDLDTWQLAEELHKPIITKIEIKKVYSSFKDNISGVDLANMSLRRISFFIIH